MTARQAATKRQHVTRRRSTLTKTAFFSLVRRFHHVAVTLLGASTKLLYIRPGKY